MSPFSKLARDHRGFHNTACKSLVFTFRYRLHSFFITYNTPSYDKTIIVTQHSLFLWKFIVPTWVTLGAGPFKRSFFGHFSTLCCYALKIYFIMRFFAVVSYCMIPWAHFEYQTEPFTANSGKCSGIDFGYTKRGLVWTSSLASAHIWAKLVYL